jgi:capsule polysaccharide export protein KpsC/LpsZ
MSEAYIRSHFSDIRNYANVIEHRLDDEGCTPERMVAENTKMLELAQKYRLPYILMEDRYEISLEV